MTHEKKIEWMAVWCAKHGVALELNGEVGFGRPCVGVCANGLYPDYEWWDENYKERLDQNGEVWTPKNAYHKHPCVAVLGRGEEAEVELYEWLKWFDKNGFTIEKGSKDFDESMGILAILLNKHLFVRMVRK